MQKKQPMSPQWQAASLQTAKSLGGTSYMAQSLCEWMHKFLEDLYFIPEHHQKGQAGHALINNNDFAQELHFHLQGVDEYCTMDDIICYIAHPEILTKLNCTKMISVATAHQCMKKMGYQWTVHLHGQYADGHERSDIVEYDKKIFLPAVWELEGQTQKWGQDGQEEIDTTHMNQEYWVVFWYHNKSTFYVHNQQKKHWVHKSEKATPYTKGEGHSLVVADFVSADYGWLQSPDGKESARVLFKAGKLHDGYFDNENIQAQTAQAMSILTRHYPHEDHVLIFDNAMTHLK
jgi:hypothetical protein